MTKRRLRLKDERATWKDDLNFRAAGVILHPSSFILSGGRR
jgi:hypothetical protein